VVLSEKAGQPGHSTANGLRLVATLPKLETVEEGQNAEALIIETMGVDEFDPELAEVTWPRGVGPLCFLLELFLGVVATPVVGVLGELNGIDDLPSATGDDALGAGHCIGPGSSARRPALRDLRTAADLSASLA
jgi:hypothetical protein